MTRPLSVFAFVAVGGPGGPIRSFIEAVSGLPDVRFTVAGSLTPQNRRQLEHLGASTTWVARPDRIRRYPRVVAALSLQLLRQRSTVDVVHANGLTEAAMLALPVRVLGLPMVVWCHDSWPPRSSLAVGRLRGFRPSVRWAAVSPLAARVAARVAGDVDVSIIPNPIGASTVPARPRAARAPGPPCVAYLGTDRPAKGFEVLVGIIAASSPGEFSWLLAASRSHTWNDEAWQRLEQLARTRPDIDLVGHVDDVQPVYAAADVVLVTSHVESFCRVAFEAMANDVPVVATDLEPLVESVASAGAGVLFPAGDVDAGLDALRTVARDTARFRGRGERAAARYRTERVAPLLLDQYRRAIGASGRT